MKTLLGIMLFMIIAALLYSNSTLTKGEEVNSTLTKGEEVILIGNKIKSIQKELNKMNNKNAKLNSTLFFNEYELHYYSLNYLGQSVIKETIISEILYRKKLSVISKSKVKDSEIEESKQKIQESLRSMYDISNKFRNKKFTIVKDNTKIQKTIDTLLPIVEYSRNGSNSMKIGKEIFMELEITRAELPIWNKQFNQLMNLIRNVKEIPIEVILSFQKSALSKYEKVLKDFNSHYKIK